MKCEPGYCCACGKSIANACPTCGSKQFSRDKTEVVVEWSNGAKMPIGICMDCLATNKWSTPESKESIAKAHFDYLERQGGRADRTVTIV